MRKQEFLELLRKKLIGLPKKDVEERLAFYGEMIDDRAEECGSEEEAVAAIGSSDEIAAQIIKEIPLVKIAKERIKPKRSLKAWEITLLALGSPVWLSLAIAAVSVVLSLYAVLWSLLVSLWAIFASFAACAPSGIVLGVFFAVSTSVPAGVATVGASLVLAGAAILLFFASCAATRGTVLLTGKIALGIKKCFVKKEEKQ